MVYYSEDLCLFLLVDQNTLLLVRSNFVDFEGFKEPVHLECLQKVIKLYLGRVVHSYQPFSLSVDIYFLMVVVASWE